MPMDCKDNLSLNYFYFAGKIVGKAIYQGVLLDPVFAKTFLNKLLDMPNTMDDL